MLKVVNRLFFITLTFCTLVSYDFAGAVTGEGDIVQADPTGLAIVSPAGSGGNKPNHSLYFDSLDNQVTRWGSLLADQRRGLAGLPQ